MHEITRRQWIAGASTLFVAPPLLANCSQGDNGFVDLSIPDRIADVGAWLSDAIRDASPGSHLRLEPGVWNVRQVVINRSNINISGKSAATILRSTDPKMNMIRVGATGIGIGNIRLEGICAKPELNTFSLITDDGVDTSDLNVANVTFSSPAGHLGFSNAVKLNPGCDRAIITGSTVERLQGDQAGSGYGILCGAIHDAKLSGNRGTGTPGRGRHLIYLSSGASNCLVANNDAQGFSSEALTIYALDYQPPCIGNVISGNHVAHCATRGGADLGSIAVYGNCQRNTIADNVVESSGGSGIVLDGTDSAKLAQATVSRNRISDSAAIGIEVKAIRGARIIGNTLNECSRAEPGVHPNIRVASDGKTPASDIVIEDNDVSGARYCRSSLQMNKTAPMPRGVTLRNNTFRRDDLKTVEMNGVRSQ